jgi:predicted O-methyltransferase YrrM
MKKITQNIIDERLRDLGCELLVHSSGYREVIKALTILEPKIDGAIEIGTHNGLSSVVLSTYSKRVFTFDISLRNSEFIWNLFNVRNKISSFVGPREELEWEINYIQKNWTEMGIYGNFDFAFIDGNHDYEWCKRDFELVKFTGRVMFHDSDICPGVRDFVNEIGATDLCYNISYWEKKDE